MENRLGLNGGLNGAAKLNFNNNFETEVFYKNGAKETILHTEPPQPDPIRLLHFKISASEGVAVNLDDVRKFRTTIKTIATSSAPEIEILT